MASVLKRTRVPVGDLEGASFPVVPVFEGENELDIPKIVAEFLAEFKAAVENGDWHTFGALFGADAWWRDSLTLTFDKRTLHGREDIVEAWKTLFSTRRPSGFTTEKDEDLTWGAEFSRLTPALASLDVPFRFTTANPAIKCIGQAKLIPVDNKWKIWILSTGAVSLSEHPFLPLPRPANASSIVPESQRGRTHTQGLPRFEEVFDAVVIGASGSGLANTILLDSIGSNVINFDREPEAGGFWLNKRYESVRVHHPAAMIELPTFPVPKDEGFPEYLSGADIGRYYSLAVEKLKLPFFGGIQVLSNTWIEAAQHWDVRIQNVETKEEAIVKTKNLVISTGFYLSAEAPKIPVLADRDLFKGPVQHTAEYQNAKPYQGLEVIVIGAGNSGHDVARDLALSGAKKVTMLQRSPSFLVDFEVVIGLIAARYLAGMPHLAADFLDAAIPIVIARDMMRGFGAQLSQQLAARYDTLESKGYSVDRSIDIVAAQWDKRGARLYMDQPKTFDLVLQDRIHVARGEARRFLEHGLEIHDGKTGEDKVIPADGVVFATGYEYVNIPKQYAESGFLDSKSAASIENVGQFGVDQEGEFPGYTTFSGRELFPINFKIVADFFPSRSSPIFLRHPILLSPWNCKFSWQRTLSSD